MRAAGDHNGTTLWPALAAHETPNAIPPLGCAFGNGKRGGVGSHTFSGAPDPAAEGDQVSATGNPFQATPLRRLGAVVDPQRLAAPAGAAAPLPHSALPQRCSNKQPDRILLGEKGTFGRLRMTRTVYGCLDFAPQFEYPLQARQ